MGLQQTSLLAYKQVKLNRNQKLVLEALEEIAPATNNMVARYMNWSINSVTPRMLELRSQKIDKVVEAKQGPDINGRKAIYWKPKGFRDELADTF